VVYRPEPADITTCVEIDLIDDTTLSVRGLGEWESVKSAAEAVERVRSWGDTSAIFRIELEGGQTKHYIVFGSVG
jgi:hypothetical protein